MSIMDLNEQELFRRESLAKLRELGIEPYPAPLFPINASAEQIKAEYDAEKGNFQDVVIAGRIMSRRIMGAASFGELQDETGRIQIYVNRDEICPGEDKTMYNTVWKKLLDIGDIVGVKGFAFITKTGQLSVHVKELTLLSKSLRVLPIVKEKDGEVFDAFSDPELKYRQRYVDLIVNPQVRDTFIKRSQIVATMREYFNEAGCLEVELVSNAEVERNIEGIVVSDERTCCSTAWDALEDRGLHLKAASLVEILTHSSDDLASLDECVANLWVYDEVNISLTILELWI